MASQEQVKASHILIKHEGSRRKASWKDPDGRVISATTREEAAAQLADFREKIVSGQAQFEDIASRYSDCSSAKRGGDLGNPHWTLQSRSWILYERFDAIGINEGCIETYCI
ncbi:peptidyl-prolyl cis-trans isomerase Pin1 isoform X2 [Dendrobium catenatum]|uniref:peptidyl-prolyl cis-trans isomerase Pin1 isoform X2 n=1 Tax=Dendrobium catenatum TaxID=906689 RepID=UPI0009F542D0|nr:peptidyl-prolyl cis-trans isomerase Pin1 isoform X2 [Dendrobium catenatum]